MNKLSKKQRLDFVRNCILEHKIINQKQLEERLAEHGLLIPQASLSRYLNVLGVKKHAVDEGGYYYFPFIEHGQEAETKIAGTVTAATTATEAESLWQHMKGTILQIQEAANLVVIKTLPAAAQAVGAALDEMNVPEIVGTLAGDDAIFIATPSDEEARILSAKLSNLVKEMRI